MTYNIIIAGVGGQGTVLASKLIAAAAMKKGYSVRTAETIGMAQRGGSVVSHIRIGRPDLDLQNITRTDGRPLTVGRPDLDLQNITRTDGRPLTVGDNIFSPLIPPGKADVLIAFELNEAVRQISFLGEQGTLIACDSVIMPAGARAPVPAQSGEFQEAEMLDYLKSNVKNLAIIDGKRLTEQVTSSGAASSGAKTLNVALLGAAAQRGVFPFDAEVFKEAIPEMISERFWELNLSAFELGRSIFSDN